MKRSSFNKDISKALTAAHTAVNAMHQRERSLLLQDLPITMPVPMRAVGRPTSWRGVAGGVGLSLVASAALLVFWLIVPTSPSAAMERMALALDRVNSYTYRMEKDYVSREGQGRSVRHVVVGHWRTEPASLYAMHHIVETLGTGAGAGEPKVLMDFEETIRKDGRGVVIDHLKQKYGWINEQIDAASIPGGSPQVVIYKVRQRRGRILQELGVKKIDGRAARGFQLLLDRGDPSTDLGPASPESDEGQSAGWDWRNVKVETWIDPKTDLPIEIRYTRYGDDYETNYLFTDLRWNVEFAANAFDVSAPEGYTELEESE